MKVVSKILCILLGIIVFSCGIILLCSINPNIRLFLSSLSKGNQKTDTIASSEETIDIETILAEIESRNLANASDRQNNTVDLGIVNPNAYKSLEEYYNAVAETITNNYEPGMELKFALIVDETVFDEWYSANYQTLHQNVGNTSYELTVDYNTLDDGDFLISHDIHFKKSS